MNFFKIVFILISLWALIYTFSAAIYSFKIREHKNALKEIFCCVLLLVLTFIYSFK